MLRTFYRKFLVGVGCISLALGVIGIFLPLLPTTPFVLLSALCFSKGSITMHAWLLRQPYIGPIITDWDRYRAVSPKAKVWCVSLMTLTMGYSLLFISIPLIAKIMMASMGVAVVTFVLTRPSHPGPDQVPESVVEGG